MREWWKLSNFDWPLRPILVACCLLLWQVGAAHAQTCSNSDLEERVAELEATIDECAATNAQIAELRAVRAGLGVLSCDNLELQIAQLEATIPRSGRKSVFDPARRQCGSATKAFLNTRANLLLSSDPDRTHIQRRSMGQMGRAPNSRLAWPTIHLASSRP